MTKGRAHSSNTTRRSLFHALVRFALAAGITILSAAPMAGQTDNGEDWVTPAQGSSLLGRMNRRVSSSSLGRNGMLSSRLRAAAAPAGVSSETGGWLTRGFALNGADLYRINCRACHRAGGEGLPPEINPILDPVRASSPEQLQEQMAARGRSLSPALAERMAQRAELALRHRLSEGGEVMAPFAHLKPEEVDALLGYLSYVAGLVGTAPSEPIVQQGAARVGEHVVKAVCHICHDAQRVHRPGDDTELPALSEMTQRYSVRDLVRKVRDGVIDGQQTRGRMPRFQYLTDEEITAAYVYLAGFPPVRGD